MKQRIKSTVKLILIVTLIFVSTVFLINTSLFDETVNPEVIKIMKKQDMPKIEGNAYYAIMGINSDKDKNIITAGKQLLDKYQQNRDQGNDALEDSDYENILAVSSDLDQKWKDSYSFCKDRENPDCLQALADEIKNKPLSNRVILLIKRFDYILNLKFYANFNDISYGTPFLSYRYMKEMSDFKKAQLLNRNEPMLLVKQLAKEIKFWKKVLVQGEMIIDKMVAQAYIKINVYHLSHLIKQRGLTFEETQFADEMLSTLTAKQLDISESYLSETRTAFHEIDKDQPFEIEGYLLQKNAQKNLFYNLFAKPYVELSQMPSPELYQAIQSGYMDKVNQKKKELIGFKLSSLYNYSGKSTMNNGFCFKCWDYAVRVHDLNTIISMVKLQLELKNKTSQSIKQGVLSSLIVNNYTHEAFEYDSQTHTLSFECLENKAKIDSDCTIAL